MSENKKYQPFLFKKFSIEQNNAAMKIGTDGILLGAWVNCINKRNGLDIGCGTGVIAIMMCQKNPNIKMTAIEISKEAVKDAIINFENCKWNNNLNLKNQDFKDYKPTYKYDLIVSNPPFYQDGYKSNNPTKSLAKHEGELNFSSIIEFSNKNLTEKGTLNLIIPFKNGEKCKSIAKKQNLHLSRECVIYPKANKSATRVLLEFSKVNIDTKNEELIIENDKRHDYTTDYKNLTRDFYTIFQ